MCACACVCGQAASSAQVHESWERDHKTRRISAAATICQINRLWEYGNRFSIPTAFYANNFTSQKGECLFVKAELYFILCCVQRLRNKQAEVLTSSQAMLTLVYAVQESVCIAARTLGINVC